MSRLAIPDLETAPEASRGTLNAVHQQLGVVPNMFRLLSSSPVALGAFMGLSGGAAKLLDVKTRERIALAVAQVNGCDYCLSAHTYLGLNLARISPEEIALNRKGGSTDPKAAAAVRFAALVARERGHVGDQAVAEVRGAGYSDAEIVEIVLVVAENILTNLMNIVADTEIDFPIVRAAEAA
ncbi:MAG: alkylhydroperoxidase [Stappia sp.]|uniref:carboxymuconolactone decarboxylase family protein n=1 Tax=Stappia sp. TaxID=1870903 RepID=UPI000C4EF88B|nr:carboxymuconolactone decarboxylase family protein [Stappia sp.]MAA98440.1 alkylhydroperoxidase [Stappia sp.]MBM19144.1 alkylhydroperoxidase [Stappia sp.]MBM20216.1 alkylhydroperoxidase [Stappia sp.]